MYRFLIAFLINSQTLTAQAYDPYTAFQVGSSALRTLGSVFGGIDEVSSGAEAVNELYSEIDSSQPVSEGGEKLIREIEKINRLYAEIGYEGQELGSASADLNSSKSFTDTVRGITKAIQSAKHAASIFGGLEKRAQSASVESASLEREILNVQLQSLNEQKLSHLREMSRELEDVARRKRFVKDVNVELERKGAKTIGRSGLLHFPAASIVIEDGIKVAMQVRPYLFGLILFVLFLRTGFNQFSFGRAQAYGDAVRDCFVCIMLLALFPELVRASFSIPYSIASQINPSETPFYSKTDVVKDIARLSLPGAEDNSMFKTSALIMLQSCWAGLRFLMYELAEMLYKYILLVLVALTPFVIFLSEMFNFPVGWKVFFLTFISINLWPILWNVFGILVESSGTHAGGMGQLFETSVVMVLQFISPLLIYFFAKTVSGGALGHGSRAAQVLTQSGSQLGSSIGGGFKHWADRVQTQPQSTNVSANSRFALLDHAKQKLSSRFSVNGAQK